jgi:hypothetical protein
MFRFTTIGLLVAASSAVLFAQDPLSYSVATPHQSGGRQYET